MSEPWWVPLLDGLGDGHMDPVAYDTAWVARVTDESGQAPAFPGTLEWLRDQQNADGSWGGEIAWLPDRILSTLAAAVALTEARRSGVQTPEADLHAALTYLRSAWKAFEALPADEQEPVGFEWCLPSLLQEARSLGLPAPETPPDLERRRSEKLAALPSAWHDAPPRSLLHSLEGWANGDVPANALDELGSCANSPSATAYYYRRNPDERALAYLTRARSGEGARDVYPFEVFEISWVLDHLALAGVTLSDPAFQPHIDHLEAAWRTGEGASIARIGLEPDADDTSLAAVTLARAGRSVSIDLLSVFERDDGFACFTFERNPSCSANIHVAYAMHELPYPSRDRSLDKVARFLRATRHPDGYWTDKWHLSPLYPTARAVIVFHRHRPDLVAPAVDWLLRTQKNDGSWGVGGGSPEETAYAVEALTSAGVQAEEPLRRAVTYLENNRARPALWIGKGLYCPRRVVDAAVAAACELGRRALE